MNSTRTRPPRKILFINPHADDTEVLYSSTCQTAIENGFEVHEVLSNADEYGSPRVDFRGRRMARIRKWEMYKAAKVYGTNPDGTPKIILHWLHNIDGHDPFNLKAVREYQDLIQKIQPWAIFGPDPFFPMDHHPDHISTGLNYFFALKRLPKAKRPKHMFFYQTLKADYAIPYKSAEIEYHARMAHQSQWPALLMKLFRYASKIQKRSLLTHGKMADKFRKVTFNAEDHRPSQDKLDFFTRFKLGLWSHVLLIGYQPPDYFKHPPVSEILEDYHLHGWV
jgi:LmbE family N-acetylglucosaminyl deacetylase